MAGSNGMSGAAVLAGLGALRGGAGLVRIYTPDCVWPLVAAAEPSLMVIPTRSNRRGGIASRPFTAEHWATLTEWAHVIAMGPGMGRHRSTGRIVALTCGGPRAIRLPLVLDADALTAAPGELLEFLRSRRGAQTVLTPHPGEMAILRQGAQLPHSAGSDESERIRQALEYSELCGAVVVLKGHRTVVAGPSRYFVNTTGNPGMATGGMGDVLTGLIAALLGQGLPAFDAASLGVHVHGLAADRLADRVGSIGYTAREVAAAIPAVLERYYGELWHGI